MATQNTQVVTKQQKEDRHLEITTTFWHSVDLRLKDMGKSRAWLSKEAGLSAQSLTSAIYLKSKLNIYTVLRITKVLDCTIEDLLYGSSSIPGGREKSQYEDLLKAAEEEKETNGLASITGLFRYLSKTEQEAVLVHLFSLFGFEPQGTLNRIQKTVKRQTAEAAE